MIKLAYPFNLTDEEWKKKIIEEMKEYHYSKDTIKSVIEQLYNSKKNNAGTFWENMRPIIGVTPE